MSTALAAYFIAAAFMIRWTITSEDAAERAAKLWAEIEKRV